MNPLIAFAIQFLQAFGLWFAIQSFVVGILTMVVLFAVLRFFANR